MSLLLDALKRAEEAKRAKLSHESEPDTPDFLTIKRTATGAGPVAASKGGMAAAADTEPPEFNLEDYKEVIAPKANASSPLVSKSASNDPQRRAELTLQNLADAKFVDYADEKLIPPPPTPALQTKLDVTRVDAAQSRDTARNTFTAKHAIGPDKGTKRNWLLPLLAVLLLAAGGGGWYVWNEVNRLARPAVVQSATRPTLSLPAAQPTTGQPGARRPDESASKPGAAVIPAAPVVPPLPPLLPPPVDQAPLPKIAPRAPAIAAIRLTEREAMVKSLKDAPASKEARVELKFARSVDAPAVNSDLVDAYEALRNADYQRARTLYARLVLADPSSTDAQLGMATVFARIGDSASAARHYRQVLVIDPRNGAALAGLLAVRDARSPSLEVELRTLVGRNPDASSLRFTLGNLYAVERRWVEAQQAYFEAYRLDSGNADYMYNLAVSLDQLKQPKLALEYYQKALAAQPASGGQFDPAAVNRRVKDLTTDSRNN